ncbi:hypothetical protein O1611_g3914 [Lasiodiplodia mahajangana]|uniref:Uncharacterized protein n=1 Tax=Lasiodiplodia mahajangana TaxID=1108764 RepID=A0ACC2JQU3_9PEZI|nr:hypothetical protein O1611_g3914 [Lasiodiplodia mahajangana]
MSRGGATQPSPTEELRATTSAKDGHSSHNIQRPQAMRFGRNFHSYTVPEWDGLYIDYNRLKQLIKNPLVNDSHVRESVIDALSKLCISEIALHHSVVQRHDLLLFHSPSPMLYSAIIHYTQTSTINLRSNLQKLQWFERVNHEAVDRIITQLRKSRPYRGVDPDAVLSVWRQKQEDVNKNRTRTKTFVQTAIDTWRVSETLVASPSVAASQTDPSNCLDFTIVQAIRDDSPNDMEEYLDQNESLQPDFYRHLFVMLVSWHSWECLTMLASKFSSSFDHYCLAILFLSIQVHSHNSPSHNVLDSPTDHLESVSRVLRELLDNGREKTTHILCQVVASGHSPLHYAMQSGFDICSLIRSSLDETQRHALLVGPMLSGDEQAVTPLHLATIEGHTSAVTSFFDMLPESLRRSKSHRVNSVAAACLNIAIRLGNDKLVETLSSWADTTCILARGQSAFHLAARVGRCDYVMTLINACASEDLNLNITDSCGRTPLMDASARGHISVVELLLNAGADPSVVDNAAWSARKYAVHRGHLGVAALLPNSANPLIRPLNNSKARAPQSASTSAALAIANCDSPRNTLVIYLGSMQLTNDQSPVQLTNIPDEIPSGQSTPRLHRMELSVNEWNNQTQTINLPLLEDQSSKPIIFQLDTDAEPQLLIRIFKDDLIDEESLLGAGAVFLHGPMSPARRQHESLIREKAIILLSTGSQKPIGTVLLTYVIARPFNRLQTPIPTSSPASLERGRMTLVGHRGFGQNVAGRGQLQLGENTIASFLTAADHGATFVEFGTQLQYYRSGMPRLTKILDAQVSRDLQTVIYHDFSLSETGTDIPIHDVTIDQYKYASSIQTPLGSPLVRPTERTMIGKSVTVRRSRSFDERPDLGASLIRDRLKHTVDFKAKAMKPNIRGDVIQEPLVTLPELFRKLPLSLGFNIEIKYPRLHEANDAGVAPIALEINLFVDTVLEQIHQFADQRPIILSSFTPEICILLSIKQKAYPVLFISNGGKLPTNDHERRVASVQAGVHFAKTWGLAGLCLASEPLMLDPELIGDIKCDGLLCASYGPQNSVPGNVLIQKEAGLDMIMVDKVALVAEALK